MQHAQATPCWLWGLQGAGRAASCVP